MPRAAAPSDTVPALPAGLRSTRATRAVLQLVAQRAGEALSETQVEAALTQAGVAVNRVTVYRLLDRLAAAGVLRRQVDAQRIARYALVQGTPSDSTASRFECDDCHRHFPLSEGAESLQAATRLMLQALALAGHEGTAVDIAVHGRCAGCARPGAGAGA
ncbi:Fur family transcriptional regulator [Acidovorax sp. Leaf160]|uniref:Fur family transcriptional regulator n=1 Tax=Acidovorax sp. Leaf160 TaxID=1736280 RepID=UPI000A5E6E79|nr:transcriptional repressor [Acidovorax sp. Leaf160]